MTVSDEGANRKWDEISNVVLDHTSNIPAYIGVKGGIGDPKPTIQVNQQGSGATTTSTTTTPKAAIPISTKCGCNREYSISLRGILRISIIILLTAGWIAAAGSNKQKMSNAPDYNASRIAYIVLAVLAEIVSIIIYLILLLNLDKSRLINRIDMGAMALISDIVNIITMFSLGITCAVRESKYGDSLGSNGSHISFNVNQGAFGAASFFALFVSILYAISIVVEFLTKYKMRATAGNRTV